MGRYSLRKKRADDDAVSNAEGQTQNKPFKEERIWPGGRIDDRLTHRLKCTPVCPILLGSALKHVKKLLFLALAVFFSVIPAALAIDTIKPTEASQNAGEEVFVEEWLPAFTRLPKVSPSSISGQPTQTRYSPASFPT
jgi:hypothetical protein